MAPVLASVAPYLAYIPSPGRGVYYIGPLPLHVYGLMLAIGVLEIIIDTVLLHEARDERIVGFAILNAVIDFVIIAAGSEFEIGPI